MILAVGGFIFLSGLSYQIVTAVLLYKWKKNLKNPSFSTKNTSDLSVLVPLKGPHTNFKKTLLSLLNQDYSGPYEVILAFHEKNDPDFLVATEILKGHPNKNKVKILSDLQFLGCNPKNSNLAHALRESQYNWIYCCDADTAIPPNHFSIAMNEMNGRNNVYATALSIHENMKDLGSCLEGVGTNLEMVGYFLIAYKAQRSGPLNGAAMLFSKDLLAKSGGFEQTLNYLTDDLFLAKKFESLGIESFLIKSLGSVDLPHENVSGFWKRFHRWLLITRCFNKSLFYAAPVSWYSQWLIVLGLISQNFIFFKLALIFMAFKIVYSIVFQTILGVNKADRWKGLFLPFYDLMIPFLWISTLFVTHVRWGSQKFSVAPDGLLTRL